MSDDQSGESQKTPEQIAEEKLGNLVNSAVTAHLKRFAEKQLPSLLEASLKPLTEQIGTLAKAAPTTPSEEESTSKSKKVDPQIAALQAKLDEMTKATAAANEARAAAEKKAREDRAFSELKSTLAGQVRPEMVDMLAHHLFSIQKRVDVGEDGSVTFKNTRKQYGLEEEVTYPIRDGVAEFLKSDDAKVFLPAPSASNAPTVKKTPFQGALPQNLDLANATPTQKVQAAAEMEAQLRRSAEQAGIKL